MLFDGPARRTGVLASCPNKHDVLAVGAPDTVGLHKIGIVRSGQRMSFSRGSVVPVQNSARGIENLKEFVVEKIGYIVVILRWPFGARHHCQHVSAVW